MVGLVHETLVVLDLVVELLLDVIFHLVANQSAGNLISNVAQQCEIIRGKVLVVLLVSNLENTNSVITKFDRDEKHISHYLVQLLVHSHVITKLLPD